MEELKGGSKGYKILMVDDESAVRDVLAVFLTDEGYDVIQAPNGEEALELAEREELRGLKILLPSRLILRNFPTA